MEKFELITSNALSTVYVGDCTHMLEKLLPTENVFILTDRNVAHHHRDKFPDFPVYELHPGESSKDLTALEDVYQWLLTQGADRNSFVLGFGGGVVCDIAGFVAATFMRGVQFGFVATSLLAQVDASVGGKNGVNLRGYKNIVGTFTQPGFVLCDTSLLHTLPRDEFINGMAETIKHALIKDATKFGLLEKYNVDIVKQNKTQIDELVRRSVQIKSNIVQADEREAGERRLLNFGHTWGHAVEKVTGIPHGKAVSIGMAFSAHLSEKMTDLSAGEKERILQLLPRYGLPVTEDFDRKEVLGAMLKDKKKEREGVHFILLETIGKAVVRKIPLDIMEKFVSAF